MINALLGIDVGTTSTKAVLFDCQGVEMARASSSPYHNLTPKTGWVEQDPEEIWAALLDTIRSVTREAGNGVNILALSMAVQSGSLVITNADGEPLCPLVTWLDGRAEEVVNDWHTKGHQDWVKPLSGWSLYPSLCLPTIAWFKKNEPEIFASAGKFLSLNDFLVSRLTGKMVTNPSNAGGMQLVEINTGQWSSALLKLAGTNEANLSSIRPSGHVIGQIRSEICQQTGLPGHSVLVNGGHDQSCTALGLGIVNPGDWLLACGTAWVFTGVLDTPDMTKLPVSLDLNFHAAPERWALSQSLGGLGASFEWWMKKAYLQTEKSANEITQKNNASSSVIARNEAISPPSVIARDEAISTRLGAYSSLNREIMDTRIDQQIFFLPMTGGHDDPATTRRGGFLGLELGQNRADLARAIMESAAYELRWALEPVKASGLPIKRFWMVGGAAESPLWPAILADVTGIPISLPQYDNWPALGAAILAGYGAGIYPTLDQGMTVFNKELSTITPQSKVMKSYHQKYLKYKQLCHSYQ